MENKKYTVKDLDNDLAAAFVKSLKEFKLQKWDPMWVRLMPYNMMTGKEYNGFNRFLLGTMLSARDDFKGGFATFKQCEAKGAKIKKGEHGTKIRFFDIAIKKEKGEVDGVECEIDQMFPVLKSYVVFDASQIEGAENLPHFEIKEMLNNSHKFKPNEIILKLIDKLGCPIKYKKVLHAPCANEFGICMPENKRVTDDAFNSVYLHELAHWTGWNKFNRDMSGNFGTKKYAIEEMIAELSAMLTSQKYGLEYSNVNSMTYIKGWARVVQEDPSIVRKAFNKAQKVVDLFSEHLDQILAAQSNQTVTLDQVIADFDKDQEAETEAKPKAKRAVKKGASKTDNKKAGQKGRGKKSEPETIKSRASIPSAPKSPKAGALGFTIDGWGMGSYNCCMDFSKIGA